MRLGPVPRFFFHLRNEVDCDDPEGMILSDAEAAHDEAIRGARSILAEEVLHGHLPLRDRIEVVDESGEAVMTVPFREAVDIED